jgi:hypothetical protein
VSALWASRLQMRRRPAPTVTRTNPPIFNSRLFLW